MHEIVKAGLLVTVTVPPHEVVVAEEDAEEVAREAGVCLEVGEAEVIIDIL